MWCYSDYIPAECKLCYTSIPLVLSRKCIAAMAADKKTSANRSDLEIVSADMTQSASVTHDTGGECVTIQQ